jgi:hypothetical protein
MRSAGDNWKNISSCMTLGTVAVSCRTRDMVICEIYVLAPGKADCDSLVIARACVLFH